jgi:hypothetical protein
LRPYHGLKEENFHEVMEAIISLAQPLGSDPLLERDLINALWGLCHYARQWGVHPDGMLRRNNLISASDVARLENWIDTITSTVALLLDGADLETASDGYQRPSPS